MACKPAEGNQKDKIKVMRTISIRTKILAGTVGIVAVLSVTMIIFVKTELHHRLTDKLQKRGISMAKNVAADSVTPILTEKFFELEMMLKDFKDSEDDIEYIFVLNSRGEVLAHTFDNGFPPDLKKINVIRGDQPYNIQRIESEKETTLDIAIPLLKGRAGFAHLGISEEPVKKDVNAIISKIIWIITAVLAVGVGMSIVFNNAITKPILELARVSKDVGSGDLLARVNIRSNDEIGQMGIEFNKMIEKRRQAEETMSELVLKLQDALEKIKTLRGFIPICASCKKIRDDKGYWNQIEVYISEHTEAEFSHGICPDCAKKLYPEYFKEK